MGIRVHELAKELKLTSKELLAQLAKLKVAVTSPMSTVEEAAVAKLRQALGAKKSATPHTTTAARPPTKSVKAAAPAQHVTPVAQKAPAAKATVAPPS